MSPTHEERWIATLTHGRFLLDLVAAGGGAAGGDAAGDGVPLLVGFHGYGENAERHLEKLRQIPGAGRWMLCAVSALHPFYNTKTGEVIDSWMTSRGREQAIDDNVAYVNRVVAEARRRTGAGRRLVYAGFSQGVAMAYRAAARGGFPCHGLIALAGDVPPDAADLVGGPPRGRPPRGGHPLPPILLGRGVEDEWYTEAKMAADLEVFRRLDADVEICVFEGGHDWAPAFKQRAGEFLARVAAS